MAMKVRSTDFLEKADNKALYEVLDKKGEYISILEYVQDTTPLKYLIYKDGTTLSLYRLKSSFMYKVGETTMILCRYETQQPELNVLYKAAENDQYYIKPELTKYSEQ